MPLKKTCQCWGHCLSTAGDEFSLTAVEQNSRRKVHSSCGCFHRLVENGKITEESHLGFTRDKELSSLGIGYDIPHHMPTLDGALLVLTSANHTELYGLGK